MGESPHFSDFHFNVPVTDGDADRLVGRRRKNTFQTGSRDGRRAQQIAVYTTMPDSPPPFPGPIIRLPSWGEDNGLPTSALFDAYLAHATGRPVIAPNAPGVQWHEWSDDEHPDQHLLTPDQIEDLKRGSFRRVGAAIIEAAYVAAQHDSLNRGCLIYGPSMGAALAGGALWSIAQDRSLSFAGVLLSEGVNYVDRSPTVLSADFALQQRTVNGYLRENPPHMQESSEGRLTKVRRLMGSKPANEAYVRALSHGSFLDDVGNETANLSGIPIMLDRGGGSKLSPADANEHVVTKLARSGLWVTLHTYDAPHDHGYIHTVRSVVNAVSQYK